MRVPSIVLTVIGLVAALLVPGTAARAADACADGAPEASFLGVVYDRSLREDFQIDVGHFEQIRSSLTDVYCLPESRSVVLAFEDDYEASGNVYDAATEVNVKRSLAELGAATPAGGTFFFMLSSHGVFYTGRSCGDTRRAIGSLSALGSDPADPFSGSLHDCELGAALNDHFDPSVRMAVYVDCSFCGGFSDSLSAVSGTLADGSVPTPSGILGPNRVVITGCAVTTECFGSDDGGVMYKHMLRRFTVEACDGWTAPRFPDLQGINLPLRTLPRDGRCTASELHFAAVDAAYKSLDAIAIQEQFRIKFGFETLAEDIRIL